MDPLNTAWMDGFVKEASKSQIPPKELLKIASRMQMEKRYPEAYKYGFNKVMEKGAGLAGGTLAALAGLVLGGGSVLGGQALIDSIKKTTGISPQYPGSMTVDQLRASDQQARDAKTLLRSNTIG
jgi:hypothetical protein